MLQHALMRIWQQWEKAGDKNAPLDLLHYETIGGLDEAISQHADEAYDELASERSRRIAEILFKLLTERGGDNREIRRPTRLAEICAVAEAEESEVLAVIEEFRQEGRSFLMPPPDVNLRPNTFIDISHVSLIRGWQRLPRWVDDEALSARIYRRLAETAMLHQADEAGLWRDPDLAIALAWREKNHPNAAWGARYSPDFDAAMSFLEESRRAGDAERMERERMRRRNLRLMEALAAVLLVGLCISLALCGVAYQQWKQAAAQTLQAEESARRAEENAQRARDAEAVARKEKERAEENAQLANQAESRAKDSALLAERNAQQAIQNLRAAEAANKKLAAAEASTRQALDDAVREREAAQKAEQVAEDERERAYNLSVRYRRENIIGNSQRLAMAQRLEEIAPAEERAYWKLQEADAWASLGNGDLAIERYKSVLDEDRDNFSALSARANQFLINKEPDKALPDLEKALNINSKLPGLYLNKALGQSYQGKYDAAIATMGEGVNIFSHLGYAEYSEREVAKEIEEVTRQKAIYADSEAMLTVFYYNLANLAASSGSENFATALEAANARPDSFDAQMFALNITLLSHKERPDDYGALVAQGALWERAGYCTKAEDAYNSFRKEYAKHPESRYDNLAKWLANTSRKRSQNSGAICRTVPGTRRRKRATTCWRRLSISGEAIVPGLKQS